MHGHTDEHENLCPTPRKQEVKRDWEESVGLAWGKKGNTDSIRTVPLSSKWGLRSTQPYLHCEEEPKLCNYNIKIEFHYLIQMTKS